MTLYSEHRITGEKLYRECAICKNDQEVCNYCHWKPVDMKNHKHCISWSEQSIKSVSWLGKLLGKKTRTIKSYCCCGRLLKVLKDNGDMEIVL